MTDLLREAGPNRAPVILLEAGTDAANVPAIVLNLGPKRAAVFHPDGPRHENHRATVKRLLERGYAVVPWPPGVVPAVRLIPPTANTLRDQACP